MRRRQPELYTTDAMIENNGAELEGPALLYWEHRLAEKAFSRVVGTPDPAPEMKRSEILQALDEGYKTYGISTGLQQTRQLLRDIESAAVAQANQIVGKLR